MKIARINTNRRCCYFRGDNQNLPSQKREFIDFITDAVKNPRDVNDCVAVPRGIFKAYIFIMAGAASLAISGLMPKKWPIASKSLAIIGNVLYFLSAIYFAKPFAFKGVSPTVDKETLKPIVDKS